MCIETMLIFMPTVYEFIDEHISDGQMAFSQCVTIIGILLDAIQHGKKVRLNNSGYDKDIVKSSKCRNRLNAS